MMGFVLDISKLRFCKISYGIYHEVKCVWCSGERFGLDRQQCAEHFRTMNVNKIAWASSSEWRWANETGNRHNWSKEAGVRGCRGEGKEEGGSGEERETEQVSTREQSLLEKKRTTLSQGAWDLLIPWVMCPSLVMRIRWQEACELTVCGVLRTGWEGKEWSLQMSHFAWKEGVSMRALQAPGIMFCKTVVGIWYLGKCRSWSGDCWTETF